ncbi:pre-mRNA cleavage factor Im 25 kDa subunit 1 [Ananas comosus]|uniref:Pre-mRNA cleavage factor Im 25 kDa subunit n=1 Tax=Ananas comosus TaxID=4615 RepID=A0A6P5FT42_ANACO|nr:pre-mRNA cleavage factor Im 25 kDa subunit 1 [Ananas comosus]
MENGGAHAAGHSAAAVEIYPLSRYYFGAKDAFPDKDENPLDRIQRLKSNFASHGLRTCVLGVLLVELFRHPHVLVLQVKNCFFKLPGGRLRPGEQDVDGLKRKLSRMLSLEDCAINDNWQIGECVGMWWRSEFETLPFPYPPPNSRRPKECTKVFLVRLPVSRQFVVPRHLKLLAVPLYQIHDNSEVYGPIISGIPHLLSKFSFNIIDDD